MHTPVPQTELYTFPFSISKENLIRDQTFFGNDFINSHYNLLVKYWYCYYGSIDVGHILNLKD